MATNKQTDSMSSTHEYENEDFFNKHIAPYTWEGDLWIDGGWGPKTQVQELMPDSLYLSLKAPLIVTPISDLEPHSNINVNKRYHVAFPGEHWKSLIDFLETIKQIGAKRQKYVFTSYLTTLLPEEGTEIYQLNVIVKEVDTTITIEKGKWIPSFEDSLVVAGC